MRLEAPPTRMNPSTSNIAFLCYYFSMNLGYSGATSWPDFGSSLEPSSIMKFLKLQFSALVGLVVLLGLTATALAQDKLQTSSKKSNSGIVLFALEDLKPGMKGVARTVFSGTEPQDFGLEILGVLDGYTGPRQSTIIARLSGPNVDRTGVFAGMSGSPVFIDDKLVGAIAYSLDRKSTRLNSSHITISYAVF